MKVSKYASYLCAAQLFVPTTLGASIPSSGDLSQRDPEHAVWQRSELADTNIFKRQEVKTLEKRRGGGGGGGGRGGGGGGSSSGGSSSGGSSSGGSSSGGSRGSGSSGGSSSSSSGGSRGSSPSSNFGGSSPGGSGRAPSIPSGGGRNVYSGGARVPYAAGLRSPLGIAPFILPLAFLSFWPGLWLASAYSYHWHNPITYYNRTLNRNQTLPVQCLCQEYSVCGCDENGNISYANALLALNQDNTTHIANVNGTLTLFINGTLPNGTTAPGGTSSAPAGSSAHAGWIWMVLLVSYMTFVL